jgi:DNA polymerase I
MVPLRSPNRRGCRSVDKLSPSGEVWLMTFDHDRPSGENPRPKRFRAREARSGRTLDLASDELWGIHASPLLAEGSLLAVYDAPAALGCFLELGWRLPPTVLDLEAEFRCHVSGLNEAGDWGFARALDFYGACGPGADSGDPAALQALLDRMLPIIDLERALLRGRYTAAVARMERAGSRSTRLATLA